MDRVAGFVIRIGDLSSAIRVGAATIVCASMLISACSHTPSTPSGAVVVTFRVVDETFKVLLTDPAVIDLARRVQAGTAKRFPNGRIQTGSDVNTGWSWHLTEVEMVEVAIELCDGRPSDVERAGVAFGGGHYCPWSAVIVSIQDQ